MKLHGHIGIIILGLLAGPSNAFAGETPPVVAGAITISAEAAHRLMPHARFVDGRMRAAYLEGHVPGAISSPHPVAGMPTHHGHGGRTQSHIAKIMPHHPTGPDTPVTSASEAFGPDKGAPVVVYGHGPDCWLGVSAAQSAVSQGYSMVYWMRDGWDGWSAKRLPAE
jgi:rhodanese-related sulfurtransferase